jgi:hypothetical protein
MPKKASTTAIALLMSFENREKIGVFAASQGYKVTSDYIRNLIEADMKAKGVDIDLSPDRGGYRIRNEDKDKDQ